MRVSDWQIVWDPSGSGERVLLALDDLLEQEIRMPLSQLTDVGSLDFSPTGFPVARGNRKRSIQFERRAEHATALEAWQAVFAALADDDWALKKTLRITPRGGSPSNYVAAILSSSHRIAKDAGATETVHSYTLRIVPS